MAKYTPYLFAFMLVGVLIVYFYPQPLIVLWMKLNYSKEDFARLEMVPVGKKVIGKHIDQCDGELRSSHNISFCVSDIGLSRTEKLAKDWFRFSFDNGSILVVMGNIPSVFTEGDQNTKFEKGISILFKGVVPKNDYQFVSESLRARPSDITFLSSRESAIAFAFMLSMKYTYLPPQVSAGYECVIDNIKCIQMGLPEKDQMVFVQVFDSVMIRYQFMFNGFSQERIDSILRSITVNTR